MIGSIGLERVCVDNNEDVPVDVSVVSKCVLHRCVSMEAIAC